MTKSNTLTTAKQAAGAVKNGEVESGMDKDRKLYVKVIEAKNLPNPSRGNSLKKIIFEE